MKKIKRNNFFPIIILMILLPQLEFTDYYSNNKSLYGNWSISSSLDSIKVYQEIYIDEKTINIFASDVLDVTLSRYYENDSKNLYTLNNDKTDTLNVIQYLIRNQTLVIKKDSFAVKYRKINDEGLLGDYLNGDISEGTFLKSFKIRHKKFKEHR